MPGTFIYAEDTLATRHPVVHVVNTARQQYSRSTTYPHQLWWDHHHLNTTVPGAFTGESKCRRIEYKQVKRTLESNGRGFLFAVDGHYEVDPYFSPRRYYGPR